MNTNGTARHAAADNGTNDEHTCPDCRAPIVANDNFCANCGAELVQLETASNSAADDN